MCLGKKDTCGHLMKELEEEDKVGSGLARRSPDQEMDCLLNVSL